MLNKKYLFVLLLLVIAVGAVTGVSAGDANQMDAIADSADVTDEVAGVVESDEMTSPNNDNTEILADDEDNGTGDAPEVISSNDNQPKAAKISASKVTKYFKDAKTSQVKVLSDGKAVSGVTVKVKIYTGSSYKIVSGKTNSKGIATYKIPTSLSSGKHKVVISILGSKYSAKSVTTYITVKPRPLSIYSEYCTQYSVKGFISMVTDKLTKKTTNGIKMKILISNNGKWITKYLTTGKMRGTKFNGINAYLTNMLTVGSHLVKIMPATKDYTGSKITKLVVSKNAKLYYKNWAIYISEGKTYTYINGRTYVQ
ncbi:hypothetical protein [Methanobrevibacter sp.]|uniref:hypothetical protein n=1 Tax=Methanobrevibacter sp. TaxID=66852 RepID=UPI0026E04334|nr:hypothetical protein [Methanobrevibacter sp.]MDO5859559.1 hypothetical protein [Methanobrevibacter sp.]